VPDHADDGKYVIRVECRRLPFCKPQCRIRFVIAPRLRQHHSRQRVHEREMTPIRRSVQRRRGFGDVFPDDRRVRNLGVAESEFIASAADRPRVVGDFSLLERSSV
jgi:hypothetical protein